MNAEFEIRITEDGSPTIFSPSFGATYHSQKGAKQESLHVFIKNGLFPAQQQFRELKILEVGFGTGLNTLLTMEYAKNTPVHYHTIEKIPLPASIYSKLNYDNDQLFKLHEAEWDKDVTITPTFTLHKTDAGIESVNLNKDYNLIYMDAFAPSTQEELWQKTILEKLYNSLLKGGILVTFCAKGQFKRDLKSLGFRVESPSGAAGKREMTRAIK